MLPEERAQYIVKNKSLSLVLAIELLNDLQTVVRSEDKLYIYNGKHYDILTREDLQSEFQKFVIKYGIIDQWKSGRINDVILAINTAKDRIEEVKMNNTPNLLCLSNGVLNTDTLEFFEHSPAFFFDTSIDVHYDAEQRECPTFITFLQEIMRGNEESIGNLLRLGGYLLDYDVNNIKKCNKMFFFDGYGSNGKSTLQDVFKMFFSRKQITSLSLEELSGKNFENSQLIYSRVNFAGEQKRSYIDAEGLKLISEGAEITVRPIYKEPITIKPKTKLIVACNGKPRFNDNSDGIFRRLLFFNFRSRFLDKHDYDNIKNPEQKNIYVKDPSLFEKLETEKSAIFNLFLEGLKLLKADNFIFKETKEQKDVMEEFRNDNDVLREFLMSKYVVNELVQTPVKEIYDDFAGWYYSNMGSGLRMRSAEVGKRMIEIFDVKTNGRVYYKDRHTNQMEYLRTYPIAKIIYDESIEQSFNEGNTNANVESDVSDTGAQDAFTL